MSNESPIPELAQDVARLVTSMMSQIRPRLVAAAVTGQRGENENVRHEANFLSDFDLWMHERYKERLVDVIPSFIYASEEDEPQVIGSDPDPDLCVLVDPLDTSELAVRALNGYTHILIYSRSLQRPVAAVVGDIFHHVQIYLDARDQDGTDRAFMITADGDQHVLTRSSAPPLSQALVTNYLMRPAERFGPLARQHRFLDQLAAPRADGKKKGRIGVDFGSISLCHIAAGFTDATLEIAKGFATWDLSPGHYILRAAGGVTIDLDGNPIPLDLGLNALPEVTSAMNTRQKFIAAGSHSLADEIRNAVER